MTTAPPTPSAPSEPAKAGPRAASLALWRIAETFLQTLHILFGAPEDVARKHTLGRTTRALMLCWVRAAEALLRRVLLIEAFAQTVAPSRPKRAMRQRTRKLMGFTPDEPEDWRVSFRCFPGVLGDTHAPTSPARLIRAGCRACVSPRTGKLSLKAGNAWPLAERYEALLRVFNDPAPFARRLARRLRADPHRGASVLHLPKGVLEIVGAETLKHLGRACIEAFAPCPPAPNTS